MDGRWCAVVVLIGIQLDDGFWYASESGSEALDGFTRDVGGQVLNVSG